MKKGIAKKIIASVVASAMIVSLAPATSNNANAKAKKVKKITISAKSKKLYTGEKLQLTVKSVSPKGASKSVKWTSSKKSVATVTSKGLVTAKKKGSVKITATSKSNKKVKAVCKITVKKGVANKSISLSKKSVSLKKGATYKLSVKWNPTKTSVKKVTWTTSNKKVATVSGGKVKAVNKGTATITATNTYGKKATCKVTVKSTPKPTVKPSVEPSVEPTTEPTVEPTTEPTVAPTVAPTTAPTVEPTVAPTVAPTTAPTVAPTTEPTVAPTATPTSEEVKPVVDGDYSTYTFDAKKDYKVTGKFDGKEYTGTTLVLEDQIDELLSKAGSSKDIDDAYADFYKKAVDVKKTVAVDVDLQVSKEADTNTLTAVLSGSGVPKEALNKSVIVTVTKNAVSEKTYTVAAKRDADNTLTFTVKQNAVDQYEVTDLESVRNGKVTEKLTGASLNIAVTRDASGKVSAVAGKINNAEVFAVSYGDDKVVAKIKTTYLNKVNDKYALKFYTTVK